MHLNMRGFMKKIYKFPRFVNMITILLKVWNETNTIQNMIGYGLETN